MKRKGQLHKAFKIQYFGAPLALQKKFHVLFFYLSNSFNYIYFKTIHLFYTYKGTEAATKR